MKKITSYLCFFLLCFLGSIALLMPVSILTKWLAPNVVVHGLSGNLHQGKWSGLTIKKHTPEKNPEKSISLPLSCQYQRDYWLTYTLSCHQPFSVNSKISLSFSGEVIIFDTTISGDLANAQRWWQWLNIPVTLGGEVDAVVDQAILSESGIDALDLSGTAQSIEIAGFPVLKQVTVNTQSNDRSPIILEIKTKEQSESQSLSSDTMSRLYLESQINGWDYHTQGELYNPQIQYYGQWLRFLGRQTAHNRIEVDLSGSFR